MSATTRITGERDASADNGGKGSGKATGIHTPGRFTRETGGRSGRMSAQPEQPKRRDEQ